MIEFNIDRHGFIVAESSDLLAIINPIGPTLVIGGWATVEDLEQILAKMRELQNDDNIRNKN